MTLILGPNKHVVRTVLNTEFPHPKPNEISVFLYNFLDDAGVKPVRVLQKAGLRHSTQADCEVPDAVHALYIATQ